MNTTPNRDATKTYRYTSRNVNGPIGGIYAPNLKLATSQAIATFGPCLTHRAYDHKGRLLPATRTPNNLDA